MNKSEIRNVICKDVTIEYILTRKRVKNINLRIKPDGKIYVSANRHVPLEFIDGFVASKQKFILSALEKYHNIKATEDAPHKYESGEIFRILGNQLKLTVIKDNEEGVSTEVTAEGYLIILKVRDPHDFRLREKLISKWLKEIQERVFTEKCKKAYDKFIKYNVKYPEIKIRKMKSRWGSCNPQKGKITLNSKLIEFPEKCIEYVVIHEFAHLIHPDHSKKFYDFIGKLMPDWKIWRNQLKV